MDWEFDTLRDNTGEIPRPYLNTKNANENLPEAEYIIRVLNEMIRALQSSFPFKVIPVKIIIEMVNFMILWINTFPPDMVFSIQLSFT